MTDDICSPKYNIGPTLECGHLPVDGGHAIYFEVTGKPDGVPVVVVHGGPGAGIQVRSRAYFDPAYFRIIAIDQRGSGQSTPAGALNDNTIWHLVSDMEAIRQHLGIAQWIVTGGSWGATLALVYAIQHPQNCLGLILRSPALATRQELNWWTHGMRNVFPEYWEQFAAQAGSADSDLVSAYLRLLCDEDKNVQEAAALAWHRYEGSCSTLIPAVPAKLTELPIENLVNSARISAHYFSNGAFLEDGWIIDNVAGLQHLPVTIVHGRYDVIVPVKSAFALRDALPQSIFVIVEGAGHSASEPGLGLAYQNAADEARNWAPTGQKGRQDGNGVMAGANSLGGRI